MASRILCKVKSGTIMPSATIYPSCTENEKSEAPGWGLVLVHLSGLNPASMVCAKATWLGTWKNEKENIIKHLAGKTISIQNHTPLYFMNKKISSYHCESMSKWLPRNLDVMPS